MNSLEEQLYPEWYRVTLGDIVQGEQLAKMLTVVPFGCSPKVWFCNCSGLRRHRRKPVTTLTCRRCKRSVPTLECPIYSVSKQLFDLMERWLTKDEMTDLLLSHCNDPFQFRPFFACLQPLHIATIRVLFKKDSKTYAFLDEVKRSWRVPKVVKALKKCFIDPRFTLERLSVLVYTPKQSPPIESHISTNAHLATNGTQVESAELTWYKDSITNKIHLLYPLAEYVLGNRSVEFQSRELGKLLIDIESVETRITTHIQKMVK